VLLGAQEQFNEALPLPKQPYKADEQCETDSAKKDSSAYNGPFPPILASMQGFIQ